MAEGTSPLGGTRRLRVGGTEVAYVPLTDVEAAADLPLVLKLLLENVLRVGGPGAAATAEALTGWDPTAGDRGLELTFEPGRVLMHDTTGVPALVDLASLRAAADRHGVDPARVQPSIPVDLIIDHSLTVDVAGRPEAVERNIQLEYHRNEERYRFLKWADQAVAGVTVVPPGAGIVHQVNIEHLAEVVSVRKGLAFPDTLVGTDSHTTMVNGLGVLAWGVGGIEALAAMLGQGIVIRVPDVVVVELHGHLPEGSTATDLVLRLTEQLRAHDVVGSFVEFDGPGTAQIPVPDRTTIANMSPEFGSTCAMFPIDDRTVEYLRATGRAPGHVALVEAYARAQGLWFDATTRRRCSSRLELDLASVAPSIAGPRRPERRIRLADAAATWRSDVRELLDVEVADGDQPRKPVEVDLDVGAPVEIDHGAVAIAAITSCTNTSNPSLMFGAGLLARNAVQRGLRTKPWVKTSLAPGSQVVTDYLERAGLLPYLEKLGFGLVGFGCTTCIGNSGPLAAPIRAAVTEHGLKMAAVLSGNRNFEGRISPDVAMNYLASPPLVVAYALAGRLDVDLLTEPLGVDDDGAPVLLADIWPTAHEIDRTVAGSLSAEMFRSAYAGLLDGDARWRALPTAPGELFDWNASSTYLREAPYLQEFDPDEPPIPTQLPDARILAVLGDAVTTDHLSPAGAIPPDGPAGRWLRDHGVPPEDFNTFPTRRGNHEVMVRAALANPRLCNHLVPDLPGGVTRDVEASGPVVSMFEAAQSYRARGVPLVLVAGENYGNGSSRDWAAKGPALLGVRAVLARSFERIHRSNLVGMGVLPLQFLPGVSAETLGLRGDERLTVTGLAALADGPTDRPATVRIDTPDERRSLEIEVAIRLDTEREVTYHRHGGILPYALRSQLRQQAHGDP